MEWAETPTGGLVVGPAPPKMQGAASGVLDFLQGLNARKEENERVRLLYVAATRAKKRLRFWGHAAPDKLGSPKPASRSLLALLWPAVGTHFQDLADGEFETEEAEGKPLSVARLPLDWELPALPALHVGGGIPQAQEPDAEDFIEIDYLWAQTDRKHIGTVVHRFFERVARDGVDSWTRTRVLVEKTTVAAKLSELGVGAVSLDKATGEVLEAVAKTLEDPRGRWILGSHREAVSEWALTGVSEGGSETGVMDRTFVDEEGTRWIVDFKTTTHEGGGLDAFLHEQAERHRPQLARYAQLMRLREPARPVKAALYYPLLGRFCEVALKD
jgi:ATP-dependent exoDNAse (exonuclease V) beta subunit